MPRFWPSSPPPPPASRRATPRTRALTLIELLVVVAIIALLAALSITGIAGARAKSKTAACAANLHAIGTAFGLYASDHDDSFPPPSTAVQWEDLLRAYIHRPAFRDPADTELFPALGSSYDWRDTGKPDTTLAGKTYTYVCVQNTALAFDALPGWHLPKSVQVLHVDKSVDLMTQDDFFDDLMRSPGKRK